MKPSCSLVAIASVSLAPSGEKNTPTFNHSSPSRPLAPSRHLRRGAQSRSITKENYQLSRPRDQTFNRVFPPNCTSKPSGSLMYKLLSISRSRTSSPRRSSSASTAFLTFLSESQPAIVKQM
jgi:hypothetical protein